MHYIISYETAAFIIMLSIFIHFKINTQFGVTRTHIFGMFLICCIVESAVNVLSSIFVNNPSVVPVSVSESVCLAFFLIQGFSYYFFYLYTIEICEISEDKIKWFYGIGSLPFIFEMAMVVSTPMTGFLFRFSADGTYTQGSGSTAGFLYVLCYLVANLVIVMKSRGTVKRTYAYVVIIYTVASVTAILIQYYHRDILMTGMAHALTIINMYLALQNPREFIDEETGIGNESALAITLEAMIRQKNDFSVILVAVKQKHNLNHIFGYENSKQIMVQVAGWLSEQVGRENVFHFGNGPFALIIRNEAEQEKIIEEIRQRFKEPWDLTTQVPILLKYTIILEKYPEYFTDFTEFRGFSYFLLKKTGLMQSDSIVRADFEMRAEFKRVNDVETALNKAIADKTLEVYYQPIYSVPDRKIESLEALVRLHDDKIGYVRPDEFIEMAEHNGSILQLQDQVLHSVCRFLKESILPNPLLGIKKVHINISVLQCMQPDMVEQMMPVIEQYHIPPEMLDFEITERAAITAPELMQYHMKKFMKKGISFSLDDYGTGNSNLSYMINFPFQKIKFDKEMVWSYFKNDTAKIVLEHEFEMIKKIGLRIVVEGIETKEQSEVIQKLGIKYIQGYYYGKPMPEEECLEHLKNFM